jgi:hypothetical protein
MSGNPTYQELARLPALFRRSLLQFSVLRFGLLQDGNIGIGVFPQHKEIQIGGAGSCGVALHGIGPADLQMRERGDGFVEHDSGPIKDFLEFCGCFFSLMGG